MWAASEIGTTTNLSRRLRAFSARPDDVLAVELGDRTLEHSRHQQFAAFRVPGTELFDRCNILDELIRDLQQKNPDPVAAAKSWNEGPREMVTVSNEEWFGPPFEAANQRLVEMPG